MGMIVSSISVAFVGLLGNAEKIIRLASLSTLESFFTRYFLFTPPIQDIQANVMTGRITAVCIHRVLVGFNLHALPTICPHCNNVSDIETWLEIQLLILRTETLSIPENDERKSVLYPMVFGNFAIYHFQNETNYPQYITNSENVPPRAVQITLKSPLTFTQNKPQNTKSNNTDLF